MADRLTVSTIIARFIVVRPTPGRFTRSEAVRHMVARLTVSSYIRSMMVRLTARPIAAQPTVARLTAQ